MAMKSIKAALIVIVTAVAFTAQLAAVNITIPDNVAGAGFSGGPSGVGLEDNETEPGTVPGQIWDLEAFAVNGSKLYLIGGFDFLNGEGGFDPGDLFIKVGGTAPSGDPTSAPGTVPNSYGYTHAVVLNNGLSSPAAVEFLDASSTLDSVVYDQFKSNPWKFNSGETGTGATAVSYQSGLTSAQVASATGVAGLLDSGVAASHNVLEIDLSFLGAVPSGTDVWFSYTMECGNDSMKGQFAGGFRIPDGGVTLMLLGMGLGALGLVNRKLRSA